LFGDKLDVSLSIDVIVCGFVMYIVFLDLGLASVLNKLD
jgi:hypothetical protein